MIVTVTRGWTLSSWRVTKSVGFHFNWSHRILVYWAAITPQSKCSKPQKSISHSLGTESSKLKDFQTLCLGRLIESSLFVVTYMMEGARELSQVSFKRIWILCITSHGYYLPVPLPCVLGFQHMNFGGTQIFKF